MKIYSDIVKKYVNYRQINPLIIADDFMIKDGVACGDHVALVGELDANIMVFNFEVKGCLLCKAAANYLCERFNYKDIEYIIEESGSLVKNIKNDQAFLLDMFGVCELKNRFQCLFSPFEILHAFSTQLKSKRNVTYEQEDTLQKLDCDACVVTGDINWSGRNEAEKKKVEEKEYPIEYKKAWGTVSKVYLNDEEIALLKKLAAEMKNEDFEYIKSEKMAQAVYSNLIKNNIDISKNSAWKNVIYQIHRKYVVKREIDKINEFIVNNNLKLYMVKGDIIISYIQIKT